MRKGVVVSHGVTEEIISAYVTDCSDRGARFNHHPGTEKYMQVRSVLLLNQDGRPIDRVISGRPLTIRMEFEAKQALNAPLFNFMIQAKAKPIIGRPLSGLGFFLEVGFGGGLEGPAAWLCQDGYLHNEQTNLFTRI